MVNNTHQLAGFVINMSNVAILQNWLDLIYAFSYTISVAAVFSGIIVSYTILGDAVSKVNKYPGSERITITSMSLKFVMASLLLSTYTFTNDVVQTSYHGTGFEFTDDANPASWRIGGAPKLSNNTNTAIKILIQKGTLFLGFLATLLFIITIPRLDKLHQENRGALKSLIAYFISASVLLGAKEFSSYLPQYIGPVGTAISNIYH